MRCGGCGNGRIMGFCTSRSQRQASGGHAYIPSHRRGISYRNGLLTSIELEFLGFMYPTHERATFIERVNKIVLRNRLVTCVTCVKKKFTSSATAPSHYVCRIYKVSPSPHKSQQSEQSTRYLWTTSWLADRYGQVGPCGFYELKNGKLNPSTTSVLCFSWCLSVCMIYMASRSLVSHLLYTTTY